MGNLQDARYLSFCFGAPTGSNGVQLRLSEHLHHHRLEQCLLLSERGHRLEQYLHLGTNTDCIANTTNTSSRLRVLRRHQNYQCCESHSQTSWSYCRSIRCKHRVRQETAHCVQEHSCRWPKDLRNFWHSSVHRHGCRDHRCVTPPRGCNGLLLCQNFI